MVFRFPFHWFCICLGFLCCILGTITIHNGAIQESDAKYIASFPPIIIDAGHGGADGGAVAIDGTLESAINLEIALKLNKLGNLFGVPTIMTRSSESIDYPEDAKTISQKKTSDQNARLRLIQSYPNGILYSIHQNSYPSEKVSGIQVLYGHSEDSCELGLLLQEQLNLSLAPSSRRLATEISKDIFLLKNCECIAVLIECGFISNQTECKLLQTEQYQKKLAATLLASYFQYLQHKETSDTS